MKKTENCNYTAVTIIIIICTIAKSLTVQRTFSVKQLKCMIIKIHNQKEI